MLGTKNLGDILSERESIAKDMQVGGEMEVMAIEKVGDQIIFHRSSLSGHRLTKYFS